MNFGSNAIFTPNPNSINLGIASVNTTNKLGSFSIPTTRFISTASSYNWIRHGHDIEEATADRVSETRSNSDYIFKSDFETMRGIQDFERENISMTNGTTSPIDDGVMVKIGKNSEMVKFRTNGEMMKVGTKTPEPTPLTQPT